MFSTIFHIDRAGPAHPMQLGGDSLLFVLRHIFDSGVECLDHKAFCRSHSCRRVDALLAFLGRKFAAEERAMEEAGYHLLAGHREEHRALAARLETMTTIQACHHLARHHLAYQTLGGYGLPEVVRSLAEHVKASDGSFADWLAAKPIAYEGKRI